MQLGLNILSSDIRRAEGEYPKLAACSHKNLFQHLAAPLVFSVWRWRYFPFQADLLKMTSLFNLGILLKVSYFLLNKMLAKRKRSLYNLYLMPIKNIQIRKVHTLLSN